ncbi:MAG TPA: class I SAM-dependent DNA methyltransferase [Longimicrobiaceae bacterium]|nr:class I SAM-dependent DNA methyltransferase [Longimicrobiaceae bacterium]
MTFRELTGFIWSVADLLRGDYKQADYGKVILPLTVLRRLDCVLEPTKPQVLARADQMQGAAPALREEALKRVAGQPFYNTSKFDFERLKGAPNDIAANLRNYINGFSGAARDILERFRFDQQIAKLDEANLLYLVVRRFAEIDLHPGRVPNEMMGSIFEELIRRFSEASNETAGEHFTPREVIRLMVNLLLTEDDDTLSRPGVVKTLYDPAAGTGGMLSVAQDWVREHNRKADLQVFGQELNDESYAICKADMLIKGQNPENIARGNSFSEDGHAGRTFDYMLSNPPFGVDWKKVQKVVEDEHKTMGYAGRFGAGTPRINDGSLLFLQHMLSKMKREGSRLAIVFNGSPLFSGDAGSGESEIRRWILENDWLEAIVALPDQLFYNTGIHTYVWVLTNRKSARRRGKVQLINGADLFHKMRKSLGNKRNEMGSAHIAEITRIHGEFAEGPRSKTFDNEDFGYRKITVERPLRLNFQASPERIARLEEERTFQGLATSKKKGERGQQEIEEGRRLQERILAALRSMAPEPVYRSRPEFKRVLKRALDEAGLSLPAPVQKAILSALSECDETAAVCTGKGGAPEPDTDLRDTENVPLTEDVHAYFEREVRPFLPDAWIDEDRTRIGYEIPFTRHFYEYTPLRPLEEIEAEIRELEAEIEGMLEEVLA